MALRRTEGTEKAAQAKAPVAERWIVRAAEAGKEGSRLGI